MQEIFGITGEKGHGKDTLAKLVVACNASFRVTHFAKRLKEIAGEIWGLTQDQMHNEKVKELPLEKPVFMDDMVWKISEATGLDIKPRGLTASTPREVMQFLGTEYVRYVQDNYWIEQLRKDVGSGGNVLVADTRFPNEGNAIREMGGKVIRVVRIGASSGKDAHASEVQQSLIIPDITVHTREGDLSNSNALAGAIGKGCFLL